jgi:hypothetical protein
MPSVFGAQPKQDPLPIKKAQSENPKPNPWAKKDEAPYEAPKTNSWAKKEEPVKEEPKPVEIVKKEDPVI